MKNSQIMLDLETLATSPDAVVLTLGAIRFDPFADDTNSVDDTTIHMDTFYRRIDPESFTWDAAIEPSTMDWWMKQPESVREEAFAEDDRHDIRDVMRDFYKWANKGFEGVWANGPVFDIAMMEYITRQLERGNPWRFWQVQDARTVYRLVKHDRPNPKLHHALWDCWSQIVALQSCFRNLNITEFPDNKR